MTKWSCWVKAPLLGSTLDEKASASWPEARQNCGSVNRVSHCGGGIANARGGGGPVA